MKAKIVYSTLAISAAIGTAFLDDGLMALGIGLAALCNHIGDRI